MLLRLAVIPAALLVAVAAFLPWWEGSGGVWPVSVVAIAVLAISVRSLLTPPQLWSDALQIALSSAVLCFASYYLSANASDIEVPSRKVVIASGIQFGPVYATIAASVVMTFAAVAQLRRIWPIRLILLLSAALLAVTTSLLPTVVDSCVATAYVDGRDYASFWSDDLGGPVTGLIFLGDAMLVALLLVAAARGARRWAWGLTVPVAVLTVFPLIFGSVGLTTDLRPCHPFSIGLAALMATAVCQAAGLALLVRHLWVTRHSAASP